MAALDGLEARNEAERADTDVRADAGPAQPWTLEQEDDLGSCNLSPEALRGLTGWQRILYHLKRYGQITPMDAWRLYGVYRLSAVVYRLKRGLLCHRRYEIKSDDVEVPNRFQEQVSVARYRLVMP